ncbi:CD36 family [Popillia japonica]|uniref:Sensory neuron membrane protein 2 n=1 Tax=Popillia japonica TaxID=7064 RepID=A0AAW1I8Q1_POPJA
MVALLVLGVSIGFALFFGALLTSGLYLFFSNSAESILMQEVAKDTKLENGTKQYERWIKQPLILESKIYLFNITNPEEIKSGAMPIVSEVGPFVYEKHLYKKEIVNNKSDILQYNQYWSMTFRKDLSFNSHNLKITYLNTPLWPTYLFSQRFL